MVKKQKEKNEELDLDLPKLKEKENKKEIKIKPIPLEVKKNKQTKVDDDTIFKYTSTINIILTIILLLASILLIINIVKEIDKKDNNEVVEIDNNNSNKEIIIYGNYQTSNDSLFSFEDNNNFYWFDNYNILDNNYYSGTYTYTRGIEALTEMGYTEEEIISIFGEDIKIDNIYSIEMTPTKVFKNNRDISSKELKNNPKWWYILVLKDEDNAIGYNKTIDARYTLKRK
ncbi:MAG: hypothetical protein ACI4WW_01585 [Candidatus Coprovivens sp.]